MPSTMPDGLDAGHANIDWAGLIPDEEWALYRCALDGAGERGIPFALGGGFAFSYYSRRWRDTKDLDLYVLPDDRERMIETLTGAGFHDCYDRKPYDRAWIYRGCRDGVIVDVIWAMANGRAETDVEWLRRAQCVEVKGLRLRVLPPEELIWAKLYVLQRDRCDWPDLLNILFTQGPNLDWAHLLERVGEDARVLGGLLSLLAWMCPGTAGRLPEWLWDRVGLLPPAAGTSPAAERRRVALLDSRDWFGPGQPGSNGSR